MTKTGAVETKDPTTTELQAEIEAETETKTDRGTARETKTAGEEMMKVEVEEETEAEEETVETIPPEIVVAHAPLKVVTKAMIEIDRATATSVTIPVPPDLAEEAE